MAAALLLLLLLHCWCLAAALTSPGCTAGASPCCCGAYSPVLPPTQLTLACRLLCSAALHLIQPAAGAH